MNVNLKEYKGYLFDLDGTLVSSEKLKGRAISEACSFFGGEVDVNIYKEVMGESWEVVTKHFFDSAKINPNMDEFDNVFGGIYTRLINDNLKLTPNVKDFLIMLSKKGRKIGLVSSSKTWMVKQILDQLQLSEYFDIVIAKEDVKNHKPHPEAYLLALNKLSLTSSEVLIFEDSNAGLMAAKSANCDAIAIEHEFNSNNDLSMSLKVIKDFSEIKYNTIKIEQNEV